MNHFSLTLRQRKILYTLQVHTVFVTGREIAEELGVTPRTVRNDIREINFVLSPYHAEIISVNSKGYMLRCEDAALIKKMTRIENALFSREDRIFYLTTRLCLAETPVDLFDLEDEIFVSRTTLLSDLHTIRKQYVFGPPYISLKLTSTSVCFEDDEYKIRSILLTLFHRDWDYNSSGSALYGFHFLDEAFIKFLSSNLSSIIHKNEIYMEDPTLVALILLLAIMHYRFLSGHPLPPSEPIKRADKPADQTSTVIFALLRSEWGLTFPIQEMDAVYEFIASRRIQRRRDFTKRTAPLFFPESVLAAADVLLTEINGLFGLDFSLDNEFYKTLIVYLYDLETGQSIFTHQQSSNEIKNNLSNECELAYIFQILPVKYLDRDMTEIELINLAIIFEGALYNYLLLHPERKLRAYLLCHEKDSTAFTFRRQIESHFRNYLSITHTTAIHDKDIIDLSETDLVFTTVKKVLPSFAVNRQILYPDTWDHLEKKISALVMSTIFPIDRNCSLQRILEEAYWHEKAAFQEQLEIIETLTNDFIYEGIAEEQHLLDILAREARFSFITRPVVVFVFSHRPAKHNRLSFMTLDHRLMWNGYKIRTIIAGVFSAQDMNLIFHLKELFYHTNYDEDTLKNLKTRKEVTTYYQNRLKSFF